jgi:hypothetical protein
MPLFLSLDYDRGADHLSGCGYINQEGFSRSGGHQDGRISKECFKVSEGFFGLGSPSEALGLPQEALQGQSFLAKARDEAAQSRKASHDPLYSF